MIAAPAWKTEFLEKKRRKERKDEVPLWKRELLKRIQSKNKKMSEEDQGDIVEEHIPKVSHNIFLVHEKYHHKPGAAPQKFKKPDSLPTSPTASIAIENVVIIEKVDSEKLAAEDVFAKEEVVKEYPVAGIVHRLMDRFQRNEGESKSSVQIRHGSKSADAIEHENAPVATDVDSSEACIRSSSTSMMPLLMSAAKPFARHASSGSRDEHGFHHVNAPVRKISSSTPPLQKPAVAAMAEVKQPLEKTKEEGKSEFSNLHSNRQVETFKIKQVETVTIIEKPSENLAEKRVPLINGETLHSSGYLSPVPAMAKKAASKSQSVPLPASEMQITPRPCLEKEDIKSLPAEKSKAWNASAKVDFQEKHRDSIPNTKPVTIRDNTSKPGSRNFTSPVHINEYKQEVRESFDSEMLKSEAAIIAHRIKMTSKTFKITPKKQVRNLAPASKTKDDNSMKKVQVTSSAHTPTTVSSTKESSKIESERSPTISEANKKHGFEVGTALPSTAIDSIIVDSAIEKEKSVITTSPLLTSNAKAVAANATVPSITKTNSNIKTIHERETKQDIQKGYKTDFANPVSSLPKGRSATSPAFRSKLANGRPSKGGGRSFVIDPSKFGRSAAAQPGDNFTSTRILKETSNVLLIVPNPRQSDATADETDSSPKIGKRKLTVDQIQVIGGYISLERSCLIKDNKRKKEVTISFSEFLETTHRYVSERSLLAENLPAPVAMSKPPGFGKDSNIGKYSPKFLLSMKNNIADEDDSLEKINPLNPAQKEDEGSLLIPVDPTPLSDESATTWSTTTSTESTDILF